MVLDVWERARPSKNIRRLSAMNVSFAAQSMADMALNKVSMDK
jgi:hypothetical protein